MKTASTFAACGLSHSPMVGVNDPPIEVRVEVDAALDQARAFVAELAPELVVMFGVDHLNGFLYNVLPQFCIGSSASSMGDYGTPAGPLDVPASLAEACASAVLAADVDVAVSAEMVVDHAFAQPLALLTGALDAVPVIPVFINAAGWPRSPVRRARVLGRAVGTWAAGTGRRVLFLGSGGLSHDPPVPALAGASAELRHRLVHGLTPEAQRQREADTVAAVRSFSSGHSSLRPLAPDFDQRFLEMLASNDLGGMDAWEDQWLTETAGRAVHEVRTWLAAFSALAVGGPYAAATRYYRPIAEWLVGFGVLTARTATRAASSGEDGGNQ